ncbi:hypothetical protein C8Q72DRAFT_948064 [Fomitopsis betulina]|nr:hypothetical protein C8Q72DRAFT_948064 [Fomitopsis betulina]
MPYSYKCWGVRPLPPITPPPHPEVPSPGTSSPLQPIPSTYLPSLLHTMPRAVKVSNSPSRRVDPLQRIKREAEGSMIDIPVDPQTRQVARGKRKAECPICRQLVTADSLARHIVSHYPEYKFACPMPDCHFSSYQSSNLITHVCSELDVCRSHCEKCGVWKTDPAALNRHRCSKRKSVDTTEPRRAKKRKVVAQEEALGHPEGIASASITQDDSLHAPNPYGSFIAGNTPNYTAYGGQMAFASEDALTSGVLPDFAHADGHWLESVAPSYDDPRVATVSPVHMDASAAAQVHLQNQALDGKYADAYGQQYYNVPGPSTQVPEQVFVSPQEFPNLDPSLNNYLDFLPKLNASNEPQSLWHDELYAQSQLPIAPQPQYLAQPPLAQPVPAQIDDFQNTHPHWQLPFNMQPAFDTQPAPFAFDLQGPTYCSIMQGDLLPELLQSDELASYLPTYLDMPAFPDLPVAPEMDFDFNYGLTLDFGLEQVPLLDDWAQGVLPPDPDFSLLL